MSYHVHGTCGRCGGRVVTPTAYMGQFPPVPACQACGAQVKQPHGPLLDMEEPPKRYDNAGGTYQPLDREAVNALALECAQASAAVRNK